MVWVILDHNSVHVIFTKQNSLSFFNNTSSCFEDNFKEVITPDGIIWDPVDTVTFMIKGRPSIYIRT